MAMSIDEAIKYLRALKRYETCEDEDVGHCKACSCYRIGSSAKCYDAIDVGIDTMRKYQKIKQIYIDSRYDCECYNSYEAIVEVLENEEIDD